MSVLIPLECMKGSESSAWTAVARCSTSPLQEKSEAHQIASEQTARVNL